jgi:hypothetical protein
MSSLIRISLICLTVIAASLSTSATLALEKDSPPVAFAKGDGHITVAIDGLPIAVYCYQDEKITRPYFAHVRAPSGVQVTRQHPPVEGQDLTDHDTFHPGVWMSFGDISGSDFWRIKARVRHAGIVEEPRGGDTGSFAVRNEYLDQHDPSKVICTELARYQFTARPAGYLFLWDCTFSSDDEFYFGDQEEMGLGLRMATPMRVGKKADDKVPAGNGAIRDALGRKNEKEIWGNSSQWCDYSGTMAGQRLGMTIFTHPDNLRPSWFHARDYGVLVANQFGRKSFAKGDESKVVVKPGEKFHIRYGVLIHSGPAGSQPDLAAAYQDYLQFAGK